MYYGSWCIQQDVLEIDDELIGISLSTSGYITIVYLRCMMTTSSRDDTLENLRKSGRWRSWLLEKWRLIYTRSFPELRHWATYLPWSMGTPKRKQVLQKKTQRPGKETGVRRQQTTHTHTHQTAERKLAPRFCGTGNPWFPSWSRSWVSTEPWRLCMGVMLQEEYFTGWAVLTPKFEAIFNRPHWPHLYFLQQVFSVKAFLSRFYTTICVRVYCMYKCLTMNSI